MEEKDRELWVGEIRFYLGEDNVIYITAVGEIDDKMAIEIKEATFKLMNMVEGKTSLLIDLNKCGKPSLAARRVFRELSSKEKTRKVAAFGLHPVARIVATFGMGADFAKEYFRFFKTKEEALAWLKE